MEGLSGDVSLQFVRCTFQTASGTRCLELSGDADITLVLNGCQWQAPYETMVLLGPNLKGVVRVGKNTVPDGTQLLSVPSSVRVLELDSKGY